MPNGEITFTYTMDEVSLLIRAVAKLGHLLTNPTPEFARVYEKCQHEDLAIDSKQTVITRVVPSE